MFPTAVLSNQRYCPANRVSIRIHPEIMQQLKCGQRGGPGLALVLGPPMEAACRKAGTSVPLSIFALNLEQFCAPPFSGNSRAFGSDFLAGCANKIPQNLPADRGTGVEQPVQNRHARSV